MNQTLPVKKIIAWILVVAWAIFIFFMSANTSNDLNTGSSFISQVFQWLRDRQLELIGPDIDLVSPAAHFCEYAIFGFFLAYALGLSLKPTFALVVAIVIGSCYGASDEIHQIFVPGRASDIMDWLVDTCGVTLGACIRYLVVRYQMNANPK